MVPTALNVGPLVRNWAVFSIQNLCWLIRSGTLLSYTYIYIYILGICNQDDHNPWMGSPVLNQHNLQVVFGIQEGLHSEISWFITIITGTYDGYIYSDPLVFQDSHSNHDI